MTKKKDTGQSNKPKSGTMQPKPNIPESAPKPTVTTVIEKVEEAVTAPVVEPVMPPPETNKEPITVITIPDAEVFPIVAVKQPEFDIQGVENAIRSGAGRMHINQVMMTLLTGHNAILVTDDIVGVNCICHIEVAGYRIPADPGDFFKYPK